MSPPLKRWAYLQSSRKGLLIRNEHGVYQVETCPFEYVRFYAGTERESWGKIRKQSTGYVFGNQRPLNIRELCQNLLRILGCL